MKKNEVLIVVTYMDDWFGRLLRRVGVRYSHCALVYSWYGKQRVAEASHKGVVERDYEEFAQEREEILLLKPRKRLTKTQTRELIAYARGNIGKGYDYWQLVKVAWLYLRDLMDPGTSPQFPPRQICTTYVYDCFIYVDIDILPGCNPRCITPDDIANSPMLRVLDG